MRRPAALAACLFLAVLASRAPFAAQNLWAHDSVLYARAIEQGFHVDDELRKERPHAPGYILYVAAGTLAHHAGIPTNGSLVLVSALASALAAAALFLLSRRFVSSAVAVIIAAAYAANPLVWEYSEIAMPYAVLGLASIVVAAAAVRARGRGLGAALAATAAYGVASGFRQDILVLLAPLWLWLLWPLGARRAALCGLALLAVCATWLTPTVLLSGGLEDYVIALRSQASFVGTSYSIVAQGTPALVANAQMTLYALAWGTLAVAPLALAVALFVASRRGRGTDPMAFALLWALPPLVFYATMHIGDWGYVLSALPGVYLLAGRAIASVAAWAAPRRAAVLATAAVTLVLGPALLFVAGTSPFSASAIAAHDRDLSARFAYVRSHYPAERTLILTREDFLLVRYYLPDYHALQYDPDPYTRSSRRMRAGRVDRVVVFTPGLTPERVGDVRRVVCGPGVAFAYLDVAPGAVIEFNGERYAVADPIAAR